MSLDRTAALRAEPSRAEPRYKYLYIYEMAV
jgi:hypothetical protein